MIFLGPVPPRAGDLARRYAATIDSRLTPDERGELTKLEAAMVHGSDPIQACRAYWAIAVKPRVARPELASRVTGDFCSAGAEVIRSGMGVAGPHTEASLGEWDFRPGLAAATAPTLILHGAADAIPMDLVEEWTAAMPDAKLVKIPGASHFPYGEQPDLVWPVIEESCERRGRELGAYRAVLASPPRQRISVPGVREPVHSAPARPARSSSLSQRSALREARDFVAAIILSCATLPLCCWPPVDNTWLALLRPDRSPSPQPLRAPRPRPGSHHTSRRRRCPVAGTCQISCSGNPDRHPVQTPPRRSAVLL